MGSKLVIAVFVVFSVGTYGVWNRHTTAHALAVKKEQAQILDARTERLSRLDGQIQAVIAAHPEVTMSVAVQEVDPSYASTLRQIGTTESFDAASTGKLITAATYLTYVDQGKLSLHQDIDGQTAELWLRNMIVNSDDDAWQELNDYLTHPILARYADNLGIRDYNVDDNELGAADIALVLQKLANGTLLSKSNSALLMSYLKLANYRDYIVPGVPAEDTVYHKVGIDDDTINDAAIITHGAQSIVLVIFSNGNGSYDWSGRAQTMQQITKLVTSAYFL